jgi:hypothetical protein
LAGPGFLAREIHVSDTISFDLAIGAQIWGPIFFLANLAASGCKF